MSDSVISVENLGKKYRIRHQAERQRYSTLRDVLADKTKSIGRRLWSFGRSKIADSSSGLSPDSPPSTNSNLSPSRSSSEDLWALKDVSFEVRRGEVVGIIGLPREIDFHPPTHGTGTCPQFVCRAGTAERPFHRGTNGAGKTTLLKMLNGLIKPDHGRIEVRGRNVCVRDVACVR